MLLKKLKKKKTPLPTEPNIKSAKKKFFKRRWVKNTVRILLLCLVAVGVVMFVRFKNSRKEEKPVVQTTSEIMRGSMNVTVTGSGTVQPIESYTLSPLVTGKILQCDYDKGETVEEGALLYRFEDTDMKAKLKTAENALKTAQRALDNYDNEIQNAARNVENAKKSINKAKETVNDRLEDISDIKKRIAKLTVTAPASGMVEGLSASEGKTVSGAICQIVDYSDMSVTVSFNSVQLQNISVGDSASVGVGSLMSSVSGTVEKKYTAPHSGADGTVMYPVKIKIDSGVRLAAGTTVSVTVHTLYGDVECPTTGSVSYAEPKDVEAEESGKVVSLYAENGNYVEKGSVIAVLSSESLEKELKAANENYSDAQDAVQDAEESYKSAQNAYKETVDAKQNYADAVESAQADLDAVRKSAEDYMITSPVSGVILEKYYKAGDTFGNDESNRNLMVVADMSSMVFTVNVDELDISNIAEGQSVTVTADALPGEIIEGVVTTVSKIGNAENGVTGYPVEITIYSPGNLMSGMNVTAQINVGYVEDAVLAPSSAVFLIDGMYYATVVTPPEVEGGEETEEQVCLEVGLNNSEFYEIKSGLKEGDIVRDNGISAGGGDDMMYW